MRAVLDTNVVISATLIRDGSEDRILRAWQRGAFDLVLSPQILNEMGPPSRPAPNMWSPGTRISWM